MIKITDGRNSTYQYRNELSSLGLSFKKSKDNPYWWTDDDSRQRELLDFCNKHKLRIEQTDSRYSRSATYRTEFFKHNRGDKNNYSVYHCSYCGKRLKKDDLEVDHIIAINRVKKSFFARIFMNLIGIKNVNEVKNLTASCHRCNRRKSDKQGLWVPLGFMGKSTTFWTIIHIIEVLLIILVIVLILWFNWNNISSIFFK